MKNPTGFSLVVIVALLSLSSSASLQEQQTNMTFLVTSVGSGKGADLGGLAGADRQCQSLAQKVGAGNRTWHAYLSTSPPPAVSPPSTRGIASGAARGRTPRGLSSRAMSTSY